MSRRMPRRRVAPVLPAVCATLVLALAGCARSLGQMGHDGLDLDGEHSAAVDPVPLSGRSWQTVSVPANVPAAVHLPAKPGAAESRSVLALPVEFEGDNGADSGNAYFVRLLPAYEWPVRPTWRIQHMDLILLADAPGGIAGAPGNPEPVRGPRAFGLSDITHISLFTPEMPGPYLVGVGAALGIPTATDDVLGSGKWSAGPALRLTYRKGPWNLGFVAAQRWSFAGDPDRAEVSQLMVRGAFRRQLDENWFLVSAPIITANWNASAGERWLLPLGGGIGRTFDFAGRPWAVSLQGYANVIRPTGAPTWSVRLSMTTSIPLDR